MNAATFVSQPYDTKEFSKFVYDFLPAFEEDKEEKIPQEKTVFTGINRLGKDEALDLAVYEFHHGRRDPRVTLTRDAFRVLKNYEYSCNGALAVFVNDKNKEYRFSLITSGLEKDPKTGRIKTAWSNPRRFSFVLGGGIPRRTPADRLKDEVKDIDDLKERFSVETLTKDFYVEIEDWFLRAKDKVEFPGYKYLGISKGEHQAKMTLRLITRLIFIWFLKEKGLVPKDLFDEDKIDELLNRKKFSDRSPYYRAILQNLFFATLNTPRDKRKWLKDSEFHGMNKYRGDQEYFRYRDLFKDKEKQKEFYDICDKIPFVNGGLFENLDGVKADDDTQRDNEKRIDCFSEEISNRSRLKVPDNLFFGDKGLIEILKRYNFTIEENTPNDEDVALDPELLGRVFENLLAYVNPETSEPARNSSGSFYTPREIVDYMVSESLKAYLSTKVNNSECLEALFASDSDEEAKYKDNSEFKDAVAKALGEIKILDPACGSGAFPMGILSKVIQILERIGKIDPSKPTKIYKKKLQIVQKCIYGVDIQDIAVQISKLRFFVSLLCEQEVKSKEEDENYGIETLPNLETKIVCANALISLPKSEYDFAVDEDVIELKDELFEIRREYFNEKEKAEKRKLRKTDKKLREKLGEKITEFVQNMIDRGITEEKRKISQCNKNLEEIKEPKYEEIEAAPEQLELGLEGSAPRKPQQQKIKIDVNEPERTRLKREISKSEDKIFRLERDRESDPSIIEAKAVAEWNPYDPSKCAEFFSPEWMFGVPEGFDVVIGNPPYISTKGVSSKDKIAYEREFGFSDDTYNLFTSKGLSLCNTNGLLSFITPKTFWTTQTKLNMRKLLLDKTIDYIFDTANPFEAAMVDTCVFQVRNTPCGENHKIEFLDGTESLTSPKRFSPIKQSIYANAQNEVIFKPTELNLKIYELYNDKVKKLYDTWWKKIKRSDLIEKNKAELEKYRNSLKPGDVALLGCLTDGGVGLQTGNNGKYIAALNSTKWAEKIKKERPKKLAKAIKNYGISVPGLKKFSSEKEFLASLSEQEIADLFDKLKEKYGRDIFGQGYIYKVISENQVVDVDKLSKKEKEEGIDPEKKHYVPYDKGDKEGNRWYSKTPYAIAWTKENVRLLNTDPSARYQGYVFYFREGFCWNNVTVDIKCRLKGKTVHSTESMSFFSCSDKAPTYLLVAMMNSAFVSLYKNSFINSTVHCTTGDAKLIPIVIPTESQCKKIKGIFDEAVKIRREVTLSGEDDNELNEKLLKIEKLNDSVIDSLYLR